MLRWVVNVVVLIAMMGLAIGATMWRRDRDRTEAIQNEGLAALRRFEQVVKFKAATGEATLNNRGWPVEIDPAWFRGGVPRNGLVPAACPWLEIAGPQEADQRHPAVRMTVDDTVPGYWYNPAQGIVRARVPVMVSDEAATLLYNRLNASDLTSIFDAEPLPPGMKRGRGRTITVGEAGSGRPPG